MKSCAFATKLPEDLAETLDKVCKRFGLKKNFLVESALREKLEDLLDAEDLRQAIGDEVEFVPWNQVRPDSGKGGQ
ncbi:MAG: hypothetical protein V1809_08225 [Planctomycetota bacterium]